MLEKIDLTKSMSKSEYRTLSPPRWMRRLALLQRECRSAGIPIIILFGGLGASGKGTLISSPDPAAGSPRLFRIHYTASG